MHTHTHLWGLPRRCVARRLASDGPRRWLKICEAPSLGHWRCVGLNTWLGSFQRGCPCSADRGKIVSLCPCAWCYTSPCWISCPSFFPRAPKHRGHVVTALIPGCCGLTCISGNHLRKVSLRCWGRVQKGGPIYKWERAEGSIEIKFQK